MSFSTLPDGIVVVGFAIVIILVGLLIGHQWQIYDKLIGNSSPPYLPRIKPTAQPAESSTNAAWSMLFCMYLLTWMLLALGLASAITWGIITTIDLVSEPVGAFASFQDFMNDSVVFGIPWVALLAISVAIAHWLRFKYHLP